LAPDKIILYTLVIYWHILILDKECTRVNYRGMFYNTGQKYDGILTLEKVGIMVNYWGIFITLAPGENYIKHFTAVIYVFFNKLKCLSLASLSSLVQCLRVRPGAYPRVHSGRLRPYLQTDKKINTKTDRQTDTQADTRKQTDRKPGRQAGRQADRQADKQRNRQTNKQTKRQIGR
jgi:hypothetical protein